jgi:hypothetical protein
MKLGAWMRLKNMDDAAVAGALAKLDPLMGFSASGVQKWRLGQRIPDRERMPLIVMLTDGAVTANDFYPTIEKAVS